MFLFWSWSFLFPFVLSLISLFLMLSGVEETVLFSISPYEGGTDSFFVVDSLSLVFLLVVSVVSTSVLVYSLDYMMSSLLKKKFIITLFLFILSMFLLSVSSDLFWLMVGWDGLGLSSLCLIMYFQNWKSFNSAMVTFLSNRLGDSFILISLVWFFSLGESKSVFSSSFSILLFFLIMGGFSKSAQIPFSSWLPLAMAAPTPVSSLVHSSTLVTAGVYLFIRFKEFIFPHEWACKLIFFLSSLTIFLASSSSLGEFDLKKIIALSTLSHIGLMMLFLSMMAYNSVLIHLFCHAMFKSLLFMISGDLIHKSGGEQDIRRLGVSSVDFPMGVSLVVSLASMIGLPFFSGFVSKEKFILLSSSSDKFSILFVFFVAATLTSSYSFRILNSLISNFPALNSSSESSFNWKVFSIMASFSTMSGVMFFYLWKEKSEDSLLISPSFFLSNKFIFFFLFMGGLLSFIIFISKSEGAFPSFFFSSTSKMWWILSLNLFPMKWGFSLSWLGMNKMDSKGLVDYLFLSKLSSLKPVWGKLLQGILFFPFFWVSFSIMTLGVFYL